MDCSMPGLPVLHHLWEFSQVHVHEYLSLNLKARRGCNLSGSRWSGVGPAEKYGLQHCLGVKWDLSGQRLKRSEAILVKVSQPWHYCHLGQDNHDGVITNLEPDILECEVKWALGSITTNKASGGDRIPVSHFESSKMMLLKCCTQYASKFGKLSSGHRTGKGQFSFQSQRKAMPKNAQTTTQLRSSHTLVN